MSTPMEILASLAAADALCSSAEFMEPGEAEAAFAGLPLAQRGAEHFNFAPGEATDDSQQVVACLLALREARVQPGGLRGATRAAFQGLQDWVATEPPDVGIQTRRALERGRLEGGVDSWANSGSSSAGNGSLMRAAWVYLAGWRGQALAELSVSQSALTHADPRCMLSCALLNLLIEELQLGHGPQEACQRALERTGGLRPWKAVLDAGIRLRWENDPAEDTYLGMISQAQEQLRERVERALDGEAGSQSGFVLNTLQSALARALHPQASWSWAMRQILEAGEDADTVACVAGAVLAARGLTPPAELRQGLRLGHSWRGWQRSWLLEDHAAGLVEVLVEP